MPSSKDPAATQEFKISALPPEAAEDSDLISALNEVGERSLRERGGRPLGRGLGDSTGEFGMLAHRAQPSGHRHRMGTCLIRRAESMRLGMQHYAVPGFAERTSGPAPRPRLKNPDPCTETGFPGSAMCERLNLGLARVPGPDDAGTARFHRNPVLSLPVVASIDHLHEPPAKRKEMKW
jgi:hypothetical protein